MADFKSLERFIQDSSGRAFLATYRLAGNPEEAEELIQETLYRIVKGWDRYDPSRPLEGWFMTIMRHAFLDSRRRHSAKRNMSINLPLSDGKTTCADLPSGEEDILRRLERQETAEAVRRAVNSLGPEQKAVLILCDFKLLRHRDVARVLKLSLGTVRSRLFRARSMLRRSVFLSALTGVDMRA